MLFYRERKKDLAAQKRVEREAKQAQLIIYRLAILVNENPPGGVKKNRIYNRFLIYS